MPDMGEKRHSQATEQAIVFECNGDSLVGVLHQPEQVGDTAVLVVVGGPQYRIGSHRQFLLLARDLAAAGFPVLRFDYRSMGDSGGQLRDFEAVQTDIAKAVDQLLRSAPQASRVVIWGLCDAASAACFYAHTDHRVHGLVLLNPWVRTDAGIAKAYLKHYYLNRLLSLDMWKKVLSGKFDFAGSVKSLTGFMKSASGGDTVNKDDGNSINDMGEGREVGKNAETKSTQDASLAQIKAKSENRTDSNSRHGQQIPLPDRMYRGLKAFNGSSLLILSGDDLTADEFRDTVKQSRPWKRLLSSNRFSKKELAEANHTFSQRQWRDRVSAWTIEWLKNLH